MKRLLVLFLVLAMASTVSASYVVSFVAHDGKTEVKGSDNIQIDVVTTQAVIGLDLPAITDGGAGGVASGPLTLNAGFNAFADPGYLVNAGGILIKWVTGNCGTGASVIGTMYSFMYHVPDGLRESDTITIGDYSTDPYWLGSIGLYPNGDPIYAPFGPLVLHIMPEPMTLTLLGLGSLLLLRKKR